MSPETITTIIFVLACISAGACISAFVYLVIRVDAHKWLSATLSTYAKAVEVLSTTFYVAIFFPTFLVSCVALYDPRRMTAYLMKIISFLWNNVLKY